MSGSHTPGSHTPGSHMFDLIGNTPLVKLNHLAPHPGVELWAKLESHNPTGSLKDRIARYMIEEAERRGELDPKNPGRTVIEATSGNTGIALGMVCAVRGYACNLLMLESKSLERRFMLRYWGAELTLTPADDADSHIWQAKQMVADSPDDYYYVDQNENEDNVLAHYHGTGAEIVAETEGRIDAFIAGFGTGGTMMGVGRALKEAGSGAALISVEPEAAISRIDGLKYSGEGYMPPIWDEALIDEIVPVPDSEAIRYGRLLARQEGILAGISSGATACAAVELARKMEHGRIVFVVGDRGERYFSTPLFDEARVED